MNPLLDQAFYMHALLYNSELWSDLIFHALLTGSQPAYYNETGGQFDHAPFEAALAEAERVIKYEGLKPIVDAPIEWSQSYIATRADVGGRILWRVTVSPQLTTSTHQGADLIFNFSDGTTFRIPHGNLIVENSVSAKGYWVYQ